MAGCDGRDGDPMTAPYEEFAERLRLALDRIDFAPGRARTGALADRYAVSRETARKWLTGLALPELARIVELAKDFDTSFEWLATGRGQVQLRINESPPVYRQLTSAEVRVLELFNTLPEAKRKLLLQFFS
jgi:transcriptional regulator with XRE-family HTH domain